MQIAENINVSFSIKGIEIVRSVLNQPPQSGLNFEEFTFNIGVEQKIDETNKIILVFVNTDILSKGVDKSLASLSTLCIYHVANFEDIIKKEEGRLVLPDHFVNLLSSISISTSRGVMFTFFRGTYLHKAILPVIDPLNLKPQ
ncbi:MAG: hypothetical protein JNK20_02625 [Flavipsychrobacter sp.]|nr:hypothetical protein [Flavipsychrobacter sp.]